MSFACKGFFDSHVIVDNCKRKSVDSNQPETIFFGKKPLFVIGEDKKLLLVCCTLRPIITVHFLKNRYRQRDRETERWRDRETERQRDGEMERQRDRETERLSNFSISFGLIVFFFKNKNMTDAIYVLYITDLNQQQDVIKFVKNFSIVHLSLAKSGSNVF